MKRNLFLTLLSAAIVLSACSEKGKIVDSLSMLEGGKTFAVPTGTVADQFVQKRFPDARIIYFNSVLDCAIAVKTGKADAGVYDKPILKNIAAKNEGLTVLSELLADDLYGFAVQMEDTALKGTIDQVVAELKTDGTYDEMMIRWFPEKGEPAPMPVISTTGTNGVLRFGTAAVTEPMAFMDKERKIVGFDIELAAYVARKLDKNLEVIDMEFGAMLPALIAGKVDLIGAGLSITEERAKKVLFSESYYPSGIAAVVRTGEKISSPAANLLHSLEDIRTRRIGVLLGSVHDSYATKTFPESQILQYQTVSDLLIALNSNKTDVCFFDHTGLKDIFDKNPDLGILAPNVFSVGIGAGFHKESSELRAQFNSFLEEIKSNGIYDDMTGRWMDKNDLNMPDIPVRSENGSLRVGVVSDVGLPFTIVSEGRLVGFDIELGSRFAAWLGKEYVPVDIQFGSMIAALATKKIDLNTCSMMITAERQKQIDFSSPYYESGVTVIALKKNLTGYQEQEGTAGKKSFLKSLSESFYNNIILEKRYLLILNGLKITIIISLFAAIFGTLIGALICYMRMAREKTLSVTARGFISLIRGTPVLVLLMIIFYVIFASVNINPVIVAILAFGINFGAYVSEMFRTSIQSVDKGQREAGIASGFTKIQTFIHIILPQALRQVLPVYKGEFISLMKMTSIVGYIAVQDLTKASDIIRSRTFDAFFPLLMAAFIYLILAWLLTWGLGYIEISVDPKRRRIKKIKEAYL